MQQAIAAALFCRFIRAGNEISAVLATELY
jgi:hypothetical protein